MIICTTQGSASAFLAPTSAPVMTAAYDAGGLIGEGTHERVMVNGEAFEQRTHTKAENLAHRDSF